MASWGGGAFDASGTLLLESAIAGSTEGTSGSWSTLLTKALVSLRRMMRSLMGGLTSSSSTPLASASSSS